MYLQSHPIPTIATLYKNEEIELNNWLHGLLCIDRPSLPASFYLGLIFYIYAVVID